MKRTGHLIESIASLYNLQFAFWRASRGKAGHRDVQSFARDLDIHLLRLRAQLLEGNINVGNYRQFRIFEPKERIITAPCFGERVLHHALMAVCEPILDRRLIFDTYACRTGKGREAAIARSKAFSKQFGWFLKLDIRKYFDSVHHDVLMVALSCVFKDPILLACFQSIIRSYSGKPDSGTGIPIGSLTSQHFANFYLGSLDRFIKETIRLKGYVRYMDDMILWGDSHAQLDRIRLDLESFLHAQLRLQFRPHPFINKTSNGVSFLGAKIFPSHATLNRSSRLRLKRGVRSLEFAVQDGTSSEQQLQQRATSMVAFATSGQSKSWRYRFGLVNCPNGVQP
jgi:RNA-directed DNA polymerase